MKTIIQYLKKIPTNICVGSTDRNKNLIGFIIK